jgi:hypothetical protein
VETTHYDLSREQCWEMIVNKKCGMENMTCEGSSCYHEFSSVPEYSIWEVKYKTGYNCMFSKRAIEAHSSKVQLFQTSNRCTAMDLYCKLHDSLIVWKNDIIHTCPYERLYDIDMHKKNELTYYSPKYNMLISINNDSKTHDSHTPSTCVNGIVIKETNEGLYVHIIPRIIKSGYTYPIDFRASNDIDDMIPKSNLSFENLNSRNDLMITTIDANTERNIETLAMLSNAICEMNINTLKLFAMQDDTFMLLDTFNSGLVPLYTHNGLVFLPKCRNISRIEIDMTTSLCYADIPIIIVDKETKNESSVFLTSSGVIRKSSRLISCENLARYIQLPNGIVLMQKGWCFLFFL